MQAVAWGLAEMQVGATELASRGLGVCVGNGRDLGEIAKGASGGILQKMEIRERGMWGVLLTIHTLLSRIRPPYATPIPPSNPIPISLTTPPSPTSHTLPITQFINTNLKRFTPHAICISFC